MSDSSEKPNPKKPTPANCLIGATISGALGYALYTLTASIIQTFATKPLTSSNLYRHLQKETKIDPIL